MWLLAPPCAILPHIVLVIDQSDHNFCLLSCNKICIPMCAVRSIVQNVKLKQSLCSHKHVITLITTKTYHNNHSILKYVYCAPSLASSSSKNITSSYHVYKNLKLIANFDVKLDILNRLKFIRECHRYISYWNYQQLKSNVRISSF